MLSVVGAVYVIFSYTNKNLWKLLCSCKNCLRICCNDDDCADDSEAKSTVDEIKEGFQVKGFQYFMIRISIADIIVALAHLWGLLQNLEGKFLPQYQVTNNTVYVGTDAQCTLQGALNIFATISSFLWTVALSTFLFWSTTHIGASNKRVVDVLTNRNPRRDEDDEEEPNCCDTFFWRTFFWPIFCWGIPFILVFGLAVANAIGFAEDLDTGISNNIYTVKGGLAQRNYATCIHVHITFAPPSNAVTPCLPLYVYQSRGRAHTASPS